MQHEVPAALPLLFFAAALAAAPSLSDGPTPAALLAVAAGLVSLLRRVEWRRRAATALLSAAAGVGIGSDEASRHIRERAWFAEIPRERFVMLRARIDRDWSPRGTAYVLRAEGFTANDRSFEQPLLVYAPFEPPPIADGEFVIVEGLLRRNERGLFTVPVKSPRLLSYSGELSRLSPRQWNRALSRRLHPLAASHPREVALVEALVLGRGERLAEEDRTSFRRAGTYHLLVFSGLQIALAAGVIAWLLRFIRLPRLSDWLLLLFAVGTPPFIGDSASVSRASVAIGVYALSRILHRPTSVENLWCVAALIRLILEPSDLVSPAFHLTYAGAGALLFIAPRRALLLPIGVEVTILPLTLFHFHQYALGGSLLTVVLTPLIFLMLVAGVIVFIWPDTIAIITGLNTLCGVVNDAGVAGAGSWSAPPLAAMVAAAFAAIGAVAFIAAPVRRWVIVGACLLPLALTLWPPWDGSAEMTVFDVGQGDAILLRSDRSSVLVDGGGRSGAPAFGETTLLPLLADRGVRRLDAVVLTHAHPDHCGGIPAVLDFLEVGALWITPRHFSGECAGPILEAVRSSGTPVQFVRSRQVLALPGIHATVFGVPGHFRRAPENNRSLIVRAQIEGRRILLTGDIEKDAELRYGGSWGRADVLKVAHHGSRSSTLAPFLDETRPRVAVVSAGRGNPFGHPHAVVVDRIRERSIRLWRTDFHGTITLRFTQRAIFAGSSFDTSEQPPLQ